MKLTLLLFFTLVVAVSIYVTIGVEYEVVVERIAGFLKLTKDEVQTCFNNKGITLEDLMKFEAVRVDNLQTTEADNITLKIGCLFACLGQKKKMMTGARINVDKIKEIIHFMSEKPRKLAQLDQIVELCANQVLATVTDECEVARTFVFCMN